MTLIIRKHKCEKCKKFSYPEKIASDAVYEIVPDSDHYFVYNYIWKCIFCGHINFVK